VKISPEPRQHGERPGAGGIIWQAIHHGLRSWSWSFGENT
jgi:hypothetical protein